VEEPTDVGSELCAESTVQYSSMFTCSNRYVFAEDYHVNNSTEMLTIKFFPLQHYFGKKCLVARNISQGHITIPIKLFNCFVYDF
jgi:hypothetical protein